MHCPVKLPLFDLSFPNAMGLSMLSEMARLLWVIKDACETRHVLADFVHLSSFGIDLSSLILVDTFQSW